ncbi:MAG: (4Fe-4S)-binding protein [Armatimonadota bacterium]|nr:MAG: (4Fe-4S)-binding protein [Armatimonadota bacterium]
MSTVTEARKRFRETGRVRPRFWRMQNVRRMVQIVFLALFLLLLAFTVYPVRSPIPVDFFFRADPLAVLSTFIASREVIGALIPLAGFMLILTVVLGRFFCGWFCPMGTVIDLSDRFLVRWKRRAAGARGFPQVKYYLLAMVLVSALFSVQIAYFFDPFAILTRTVVWVLFAPIALLGRMLTGSPMVADWAPALTHIPFVPESQPHYRMNLLAALLFGGILALGLVSRRFWCRNLCPLGALLALLSGWGIVRRQTQSDRCIECHRCDRECKMGSILPDSHRYLARECIYCYNCVSVCAPGATSFPITLRREGFETGTDIHRRRLLGFAALGMLWAGISAGDTSAKRVGNSPIKASSPFRIRPPGSLPEDQFLQKCVRCSLCMKVCPTNGLQPALTEAGIEGFWTPVLVPRIGHCAQHCTACGDVCPTDAIQPFTAEEKKYLFIGRAYIDRSTCIVWAQDKKCLVCDEHCSYRALYWKVVDGLRRPFVNEYLCTGCGECEAKCPVQPIAAIRVNTMGDLRHLTREAQKRFYERHLEKKE